MMCLFGGLCSSLLAQTTVTIDGTVGGWEDDYTTDSPFNTNHKYNTTQQFYYADELGIGKSTITHVSFYVETKLLSGEVSRNMKIYMVNTEEYKFSTKYPKLMSSNDLVFDGTVSFDAQQKWITIDLDTDFEYSGNNILLCTYDYTGVDPNKNTNFDAFIYSGKEENGDIITRGLYKRYSTAYDPELASTANTSFTTNKYIPDIKFTYSSGGSAETPAPTAPTLNYPSNNQENVFNPFLRFTLGSNTTHYQIQMGTNQDNMTALTDWVEKTTSEVDYQTSNLTYNPATKYFWKVVAKNDKNNDPKETSSEIYSFTTKQVTEKPGQITDAYPNGKQDLQNPEFTWTFGENTEEYQVLIDGEVSKDWTNPGSATTGKYQTSGLSAGNHTWRIDAKNYKGTTTGTEYSFSIASLPDNVTPVSPVDGATGVTSSKIKFQFAKGTTHYRILYSNTKSQMGYISANKNGVWTSTNGDEEVEFEMPGFTTGKTYYWAVDVKNSIGTRAVWKTGNETNAKDVTIYSFTTAAALPVANTAPENGAFNLDNPTLKWNYVGAARSYMVYLGTTSGKLDAQATDWTLRKSEEVGTGIEYETSGSYQTENLTAATTYFWRVDIKDEAGNVIPGEEWSFVTTLKAPQNVQATPENVEPSLSLKYGETTIMWSTNDMTSVLGYNVYLNGEKLNNEPIAPTKNSYKIEATTMKLTYNMNPGHKVEVEAVYDLGTSKSEIYVKVSGAGYFVGRFYSNDFNHRLADATVTLTRTKDDFGNEYDGNGKQYTYTTNSDGEVYYEQQMPGGETSTITKIGILDGTYNVTVEKACYETYEGTIDITNGSTSAIGGYDGSGLYGVILKADPAVMFNVTLSNVSFNSVDVYLENNNWEEAQEGSYHVYLKNGENIDDLEQQWFVAPNNMTTSVYFTYNGWATLGKGDYQFGVAKAEDQINWSAVQKIDYDVFDGSGNWNDAANWRDGKPGEDATVYLLANATITASDIVTTGTVNIKSSGSLTINGSLTANEVVNEAGYDALVINEGGQLRQDNKELTGKFVMNVKAPNEWAESNTDGWQFIASPVEGVEFSKFVPANNDGQGDYDLYQYDGKNNKWRNHKHVYGEDEEAFEFGDKFVVGTAYLAALQYERDVMFSGILNAAKTHTFNVSHNAEKNAANFHLLGNPFTFAMDVKNLQASGLATGYAVLNAEGNDYTYITTGQIPVGDGFFVMATESTAALSYSETATRSAAEETANINIVAKGAAGSNNVIINMAGDKEGFRKLEGFNKEIANIYVENKGNKYAIYNCESDANEVELTFVAKQMGSYSLSFDINGEFETVTLVDRMTGVETDMIAEGEYNFIATSNDMKNRFAVRLSNSMTSTEEFLANFVYQSGEELIINAEGTIQIIDMMGRVVYSNENANGNDRISVSEFNNAAYVVRVINGNGVKSQKVVIY